MNRPPEHAIRVNYQKLHTFVEAAGLAVGLSEARAGLLAELLVANDLRGVVSHGTHQIVEYTRLMRAGSLNAKPQVEVVKETPTSVLVDGDGGLGYFAAFEGTRRLIDKAAASGIAIMMSRNHGHFGAAGIYARMPLKHDMLTFVTSGHRLNLQPGQPLITAAGGSPMAFSAPAGDEESPVLDFGAMHGIYGKENMQWLMERAPGLVLRCIGMGEFCQTWGGLMAGLPIDAEQSKWEYSGANQGAMVITFRVDLFMDLAEFKAEMDEYVRRVRQLAPLDGFDQTYMPGGLEAERELEYRRAGVPVGNRHRQELEKMAQVLNIEVPWN